MNEKIVICPDCGRLNDDNWLLRIDGKIEMGGCQDCWEKQSDEEWWEILTGEKPGGRDGGDDIDKRRN